jgi:hypothetical protein
VIWTCAFWVFEASIVAVIVVTTWRSRAKYQSVDVAIGNEIGNFLLGIIGGVVAVIAGLVYVWHHFRFVG